MQEGLATLGISFYVNPRLVRGLDYYSHSVFEFTTDALGAQGTVLAGGRYDSLIATMGGPDTAGSGWAAGVERLHALVNEPVAAPRPVAIVPMGDAAEKEAAKLAHELRHAGFVIEIGYRGNAGKRMKRANKLNASVALVIGDDELNAGVVALKKLDSGEQEMVKRDAVIAALKSFQS